MSWFSSAVHDVGNFVTGDGNSAGNADTRKYGYDTEQVANSTAVILNQPAPPAIQGEVAMLAGAGLLLILLLRPKAKR
jgi:hypothetical protein